MDILQTKGYDVLFHEYAGTLSVKKKMSILILI